MAEEGGSNTGGPCGRGCARWGQAAVCCSNAAAGGVVLGADTRATEGPLVADKNCNKLHRISSNIYAAGAGTAADLDHMCDWLATQVELHRQSTYAKAYQAWVSTAATRAGCVFCLLLIHGVVCCCHSARLLPLHPPVLQGYRGCAVVLGGVDLRGPSLYKIHPHGSTDSASYAAMGSGSLNAMAVLEAGYKDGMSEAEATALVCAAITAGVLNDLGSGGNVDLCIIKEHETRHMRQFSSPARVAEKSVYPPYEIGTTPFFKEHIEQVKEHVAVEQEVEMVEAL
ncbi:hypothetical protein cyc_07004 [Cyclospora cayetanensis]|uniref:Proteasome endopeptidase complex n=1 Tax=Cyclospora cayetanensis TaxID=88456 RepID=A0A1D3CY42_9EIME|nr:hypothetical protein cyc_07004 [Cyclospora cayetanensis]